MHKSLHPADYFTATPASIGILLGRNRLKIRHQCFEFVTFSSQVCHFFGLRLDIIDTFTLNFQMLSDSDSKILLLRLPQLFPMKLLLIEDDQDVTDLLTEVLSEQNYFVDVAADGQAGRELAESCNYDLLLLDVLLPKVDGISLCRQLRSNGCQIPILMLSARDTAQDQAAGMDAGADGYLVKPYKLQELLASINALLHPA